MLDNLFIVDHNVETGEITQIPTTEAELKRDSSLEMLAHREKVAKKETAKKAVLEKLGLTEEEAKLLLS